VPDPIPLPRRRRRLPKQSLRAAAEHAVTLIEIAEDYLAEKTDGASKGARQLISMARNEIDAALEADIGAAQDELAAVLLRAMGRKVSYAEINAARRALEILLAALPDYSEPPETG
jgi:hypothetical protein